MLRTFCFAGNSEARTSRCSDFFRARICKPFKKPRNRFPAWYRPPEPVFGDLLRSPRIDSQSGGRYDNPICPTGPTGTIGGEIDSSESIPGLHKSLQIRAQPTEVGGIYYLKSIPALLKHLQIRAQGPESEEVGVFDVPTGKRISLLNMYQIPINVREITILWIVCFYVKLVISVITQFVMILHQ